MGGTRLFAAAALKNILLMDFGETCVFIKFGTDWCIPCQELDKILVNFPDSALYHVDVEDVEFDGTMEEYNYKSVPYTIIKYKKKTRNFSGVSSEENIKRLINEMKN